MDAGRRLLGDAADRGGVLAVPAGLRLEPLLDRRVEDLLLLVRRGVEELDVALFGARAEVDEERRIAAVVENHVGRAAVGPFEDPVGIVPILLEALALDREDRRAGRRDRRRRVVLGRIDVARGPAHVGAERLQRFDQNGGLDRHVQRAGDPRALQRLPCGIFRPRRHQPRHLGLGDGDLFSPEGGKPHIGDGVIGGFGHDGHADEIPSWFGRLLAAPPEPCNKHISNSLYQFSARIFRSKCDTGVTIALSIDVTGQSLPLRCKANAANNG